MVDIRRSGGVDEDFEAVALLLELRILHGKSCETTEFSDKNDPKGGLISCHLSRTVESQTGCLVYNSRGKNEWGAMTALVEVENHRTGLQYSRTELGSWHLYLLDNRHDSYAVVRRPIKSKTFFKIKDSQSDLSQ